MSKIIDKKLLTWILCVWGANILLETYEKYKIGPGMIVICAGIFFIMLNSMWNNHQIKYNLSQKIVCLLWAGLFSAMIVVGGKITTGDTISSGSMEFGQFSYGDTIKFLLYYGIGEVMYCFVYYICTERKKIVRTTKINGSISLGRWLLYSGILILSWGWIFLIYFPGIVPGDAWNSIAMIKGDIPWSNHFPVFYTLIVGLCIGIGDLIGNINIGVAIYSLLQLVIMAIILGYVLEWLQNKGIRKAVIYGGIGFFIASPVWGNYSIIMWKDPWFSGILLLLVLHLYDCITGEKDFFIKKNFFYYCSLSVLACLLRSNGIYIVVLVSMGLIVMYRKQLKKVVIRILMPFVIIAIITGPVYGSFVTKDESFIESVGIPYQQMARVVVMDGNINEEEKTFLSNLLPIEKYKEYYNPYLVDPLKWASEFNADYLEKNKADFFKTWFSLLRKNFKIYVEQYLMGTYGFWHIGGDPHYEFVKTDIIENEYGLEQSGFLEKIFNYPLRENMNSKYEFMPSGLLVWALIINIALCCDKYKKKFIIPLIPMLGNWLTLMIATPSAFGLRYIFVLMIGFPVLMCYPWLIKGKDD